ICVPARGRRPMAPFGGGKAMRGLVGSPPAPGRAPCARLIGLSLLAFGCILLVGGGPAPAQAPAAPRLVTDPPKAALRRPQAAVGPALAGARGQVPPSHEAFLDLNIQYTRASIYNPGTGQNDTVNLRSYRDAHEMVPPKVPFVAPTIEIFPGETVRIPVPQKPPDEPNCD